MKVVDLRIKEKSITSIMTQRVKTRFKYKIKTNMLSQETESSNNED